MRLIGEFQRHGQIVNDLTLFGKVFKGLSLYGKSLSPYQGKVIREKLTNEYRATIPGLFLHILRQWLMRKKSHFAHDGN